MRILAGDIGGTNTRLAYVQDDVVPAVRHEKIYASAGYATLIEVVEAFLSHYEIQKPLDSVCLAVAGPVISGCASLTNLPWKISEAELATLLQTERVSLINDLVAAAYAIPDLQDDAVRVVQQGKNNVKPPSRVNAVVVGVGTGLGAAHLTWQGDCYQAFSSEAGHAGFSPANDTQVKLLKWLQQKHAHVSVETVLSGRGIYRLYQFFRDELGLREGGAVNAEMQRTDPARVISEHAVAGDDLLCERTLACFVEIYAAVVGDITLHYYPLDVVYLAGGIAPKIQGLLLSGAFTEPFTNKGPMRENLHQLPVKLVISDAAGLDGAIAYAHQQCR